MKYLSINEKAILLAIWKLKDNAYPVTIRDEFIKMTQKMLVYGALYNSLDYLKKKGFVKSAKGIPTPEKGGKSKVYFSLTDEGINALHKTNEMHQSLWNNLTDVPVITE